MLLCASSNCVNADVPFTILPNGQEVSDANTGLIWRRCLEGMVVNGGSCTGNATVFTHEAALTQANTHATTTGVAWRLPNVKELASIVDKTRLNPALDPVAFPLDNGNCTTWSSSPRSLYVNYAWYVSFFVGDISSQDRNVALCVWLVRTGQ